jgi:hypothetical protein
MVVGFAVGEETGVVGFLQCSISAGLSESAVLLPTQMIEAGKDEELV